LNVTEWKQYYKNIIKRGSTKRDKEIVEKCGRQDKEEYKVALDRIKREIMEISIA